MTMSLKQVLENKFKSRIKLNHNIYLVYVPALKKDTINFSVPQFKQDPNMTLIIVTSFLGEVTHSPFREKPVVHDGALLTFMPAVFLCATWEIFSTNKN